MNMQAVTRLIKALRLEGWDGDAIADLLLYLEDGNGEYRTRSSKEKSDN